MEDLEGTCAEADAAEIEEFEGELYGFLAVYVDDIMILSWEEIVLSVQNALQKEWEPRHLSGSGKTV